MHFKDKLLGKQSMDEESARDSIALPRFSFESDDRPLVSTERLFQQWWEQDTQYDPGNEQHDDDFRKEQDIIVRARLKRRPTIDVDAHCRSPGMAPTIQEIPSTGRRNVNGLPRY